MIEKDNSWSTHIRLKEGIDGVAYIDLLDGGGLKLSLLTGPGNTRSVGFVGRDEVKELYNALKNKLG